MRSGGRPGPQRNAGSSRLPELRWLPERGRLRVLGRPRGAVALIAWATLLVVAIGALRAVGSGGLAPPPLRGGMAALRAWAEQRDAATMMMAGIRLVAVGLAWYMLCTSVVATAARLTRRASLVRLSDAVTLPVVRRLAGGAASLILATAPLGVAGPALAQAVTPGVASQGGTGGERAAAIGTPGIAGGPPPTMWRLPDAGTPTTDPVPAGGGQPVPPEATDPLGAASPPVLRSLDGGPSPNGSPENVPQRSAPPMVPTTALPVEPTPPSQTAPPSQAAQDQPGPPKTWTIERGDHLWHVADAVLERAWARAPTPSEIDSYWRVLVAANRHSLADPNNADLVFPGQVMTVPAPPPLR